MSGRRRGQLRTRFQKEVDKSAGQYIASAHFDWRLYRQDIAGSIAHVRMLARQRILSEKEAEIIISGLDSVLTEMDRGEFKFNSELEDIHMNIESRLFHKIGDIAGKLHTARSRNDQIALDMRLFVKEAILHSVSKLTDVQRALIGVAEANRDVVMPGYTHLQKAQPVLFAHYLLAYFQMFQRDKARFLDCERRTDVLPLGSGALSGVPYDIDREFVASELGFSEVSENSIDAVSDRDFVIEYVAAAAITMMHLSRLAEEMVLWSSEEFGFIEIDESYATSSSIMPQKKNPDVAELGRGKTGRVYGHLMGILTVMKGLPLAYNRDMQEDKEGLFDTVDTLLSSLEVFTGMVSTVKVNATRMRNATSGGYILATDVADYLTRKGLPFRQAHSIVGKLVQYAVNKGKGLQELSLAEYRRFSPLFLKDVHAISIETSLLARSTAGGTAPKQVRAALKRARRIVDKVK